MTKKLLLPTICYLLMLPVSAFTQKSAEEPLINVLHDLRNELFVHEKEAMQELKELVEKWDSMSVPMNEKKSFLRGVWNSYLVNGYSAKFIRKHTKKSLTRLYPSYEDRDLEVIKRNADLVDLLNEDLLKLAYPFPLDEKALLYTELLEYGLKDSMRIGEIGAGSGMVSMLIASVYDNLELYLNELDRDMVSYMNRKLEKFPKIRKSNTLHVVKGDRDGTNLEDKELDLIFMREAFHHFSDKTEMVQSIYRALDADGVVIVSEEVLDYAVDSSKCSKALRRAEVISIFELSGFTVMDEVGNGDQYLFKFIKK